MISDISVKNSLSSSTSSWGESFSEILVKPYKSEKKVVIGRSSPPKPSFSGDSISWFTTAGGRCLKNAFLINRF